MRQKFTTEENKYLENKNLVNETMFNFKISCLMKKQVFSLMMVLALVILAGTSAMAQPTVIGDLAGAEGSPSNPKVYIAGSTGSLSVTDAVDHTYTWHFYQADGVSDMPTTATPTVPPTVAGFDISINSGWDEEQTGATANFTWTESASGAFYATVTDLNTTTGCSTTRGYWMLLIGYDIFVYTSDANGEYISGAALAECGQGTTYPAFMNDVSSNLAGDAIRGDIMNNDGGTLAPTDGNLANVHGINPRTTRYFTAALTFDTPGSGSFNPSTDISVGSARMDIDIAGTTMPAVDVVTVNGTTFATEAENSVDQSLSIPLGTAPTTLPVELTTPAPHLYFTFEVVVNDRWGVDLTPEATVRNFRIYNAADGTGVPLGQEPKTDEVDGTNASGEFTIYGKPATSIITGN